MMSEQQSQQQQQRLQQEQRQQVEQNQRNGRSDDSTSNHSPTAQDSPESYLHERRHQCNTSCRHRRHQDLSPRYEDDRNIIYLNEPSPRHYRSQNQLNDQVDFIFKEVLVQEIFVYVQEQIRRSFHDRSNGLSQDTLVERQNLVLVPMLGLLRSRRTRNRTHRLSADLENSQQRRRLGLEGSSFRNSNSPFPIPLSDDPGDRPIIFTNPTNRNPLQQPSTLTTAQTLSLRSPNEDTSDRVSQVIRSQPRINPPHMSRATQVIQVRYPYQSQLRRLQTDLIPHRYVDDSSGMHDSLLTNTVSNTSRPNANQQGENAAANSSNNNNTSSNNINIQTNETAAAFDLSNSNRDREIYVLRNNPPASQPPQPSTVDNAKIVANSHAEPVIQRPKLHETSSSETERVLKRQEVKYVENRTDVSDWRANLIGSRQLWRQMLISERFADVWFVVGGEDILGSSGPLSLQSNDAGAPGGPTSQMSCCSNKQMLNISSRASNYSNGINKSRIMYSKSNTSSTIVNNNNSPTTNNHTNSQAQNDYFDALHSRCSDSDQENTIDDATDLNSDSEQISCHSDHSKESRSQILNNKSNECNSQSIRNKDGKHNVNNASSSNHHSIRSNNTNGRKQMDVCIGNPNSSSKTTTNSDTELVIWRFAAHRLILAAASPVFEAMFYGPMADCDNKGSENRREYHIPDIHPKAFQIMLSYIYSDELLLENDLNLLFYVLYATKKYILPRLTQICVEYLKDLITAENVCMILDRSIFFDEVDLTRRCWHVIDVLASDVLQSQGLLTLNSNYLQDLVRRDTLNCQESEVFAAVGRWAGAECSRLGIRDVVSNRVHLAANIYH
ncbi:unnamed protein product [Heterobilharzia americana]|nr:unnamed protein product [Heterobilharzia americana]